MKRLILILALLLITSCTTQNTVQSNPLEINIQNFAFTPNELTIKAGDIVTWINNDNAPHTVTSDEFNSGNLNPEQSFSYTFSEPGDYEYHCNFHSGMKGRIKVTS